MVPYSPEALVAFFCAGDPSSPPSLSKYARASGVPFPELLRRAREDAAFGAAVDEAERILRDKLIDWALGKLCDPTFTKYLLSEPGLWWPIPTEEQKLDVRIEVVNEKKT